MAFAPFALRAGACLAGLWLIGRVFPQLPALAIGLIVALLGLAMALPDLRAAAIRSGHRLEALSEGGRLRGLIGGGFFRVLIGGMIGALAALLLILQLPGLQPADWLLIALGFALARRLEAGFRHRLRGEIRGVHLGNYVLPLARWLTVFLLLGLQALLLLFREIPAPEFTPGAAPLAGELLELAGTWARVEIFALGEASVFAGLSREEAWLVLVLLNTGFWYGVVSLGLGLGLSLPEAGRGFARAGSAIEAPKPGWPGIAAASLLLLMLLGAAQKAQTWLETSSPDHHPSVQFGVVVELIGGAPYRAGTHALLEEQRRRALEVTRQGRYLLYPPLEAGFDAMIANVDSFLDSYYSLTSEYLRMFHWATGGLETHLGDRLTAALQEGAPFAGYEAALAEYRAGGERLAALWAEEDERILDIGRLEAIHPGWFLVAERFEPLAPLMEAVAADMTRAQIRWGTSGAAGVVSVAMAQRIVARIAARGLLRVGAQMALRAAGFLVAIGVDAALVELDEHLNRAEMRAQIIEGIEAQRREALALLGSAD